MKFKKLFHRENEVSPLRTWRNGYYSRGAERSREHFKDIE